MDNSKLTNILKQLEEYQQDLSRDLDKHLSGMSKKERAEFDEEISKNKVFKDAMANIKTNS